MILSKFFILLGFVAFVSAMPAFGQTTQQRLDLSKTPIVLLGEVHDNEYQHSLRVEAFNRLLLSGARPALLLEQFDRETQPVIDLHLQADTDTDVLAKARRLLSNKLIAKGSWNWAFYQPFIELAVKYKLAIVAVNVSRADAMKVVVNGLASEGFNADIPVDIEDVLSDIILASHCGMLDRSQALLMTSAQVARDQQMALAIERNADRGVVLLAGNGHVRKDIGIYRWLRPDTRLRTTAIGVLEEGADTVPYDEYVITQSQAREDSCKKWKDQKNDANK